MGFGLLLRLVGLMNSYSLYFVHSVFKGDNSAYVVLFKKNKNKNLTSGLYSDIYRPVSVKFGIIIEATKLYVLILVWMILTLF